MHTAAQPSELVQSPSENDSGSLSRNGLVRHVVFENAAALNVEADCTIAAEVGSIRQRRAAAGHQRTQGGLSATGRSMRHRWPSRRGSESARIDLRFASSLVRAAAHQRRAHSGTANFQHMRVNHRRRDVGMAEQILHGSNVVTAAEQGRRERVAEVCGVAGFVMPACSTARLKAR